MMEAIRYVLNGRVWLSEAMIEREGRILRLLSGSMMLELGAILIFAPDVLDNVLVAFLLLVGAVGFAALVVLIGRFSEKIRMQIKSSG